jgi:hypothetical protein
VLPKMLGDRVAIAPWQEEVNSLFTVRVSENEELMVVIGALTMTRAAWGQAPMPVEEPGRMLTGNSHETQVMTIADEVNAAPASDGMLCRGVNPRFASCLNTGCLRLSARQQEGCTAGLQDRSGKFRQPIFGPLG